MNEITLADNPAASRFELSKDGAVAAYAQYTLSGATMTLTHTEVLPAYEGQRLGSRLAGFALDDVRRRGLKAVPTCEFIARYIERNRQYQDLVGG